MPPSFILFPTLHLTGPPQPPHKALPLPICSQGKPHKQSHTGQFTLVLPRSLTKCDKAKCVFTRYNKRCGREQVLPSPFYQGFSTTHVPTRSSAKTAIRSVDLPFRTTSHCQKQILMLTDLTRLIILTIFRNTVLTAVDGCSATYLHLVQTEQMRLGILVVFHPSTTFYL